MAPVCPNPGQPLRLRLGLRAILAAMSDLPTAEENEDQPPRKKRRRVFHTAGLTASAAVLALSLQAGAQAGDDDPPINRYGDATILDPDATE
jgi:hypothetical protein